MALACAGPPRQSRERKRSLRAPLRTSSTGSPATRCRPRPSERMADGLSELAGRWRGEVVLKQDVFSTIERGKFASPEGARDAVLRRIDDVPWWTFPIALHLFRRERRALAIAGEIGVGPRLLYAGERALVRGFIDG